jgi:hypothetical protein
MGFFQIFRSFVDVEAFKVVDLKTKDDCQCSLSDHSAAMAIIKTRCQSDKTFYARNVQIFGIS